MSDWTNRTIPEALEDLKDSLAGSRLDPNPAEYLRAALFWMQAQGKSAADPAGRGSFTPADLQRELRCTYHQACRILEALERDGELVRSDGPVALRWTLAPAASRPGKGYSLPLSSSEHSALLRALEWLFTFRHEEYEADEMKPLLKADLPILRAIRGKLKRPA